VAKDEPALPLEMWIGTDAEAHEDVRAATILIHDD
jgi:hypothetical protein